MGINFINGSFSKADAIELMDQLIDVKIRFHERKIDHSQNIEDVKLREKRIIQLQNELRKFKENLVKVEDKLIMKAEIKISSYE